jgi:hypothetical protein
MLKIHLKCMGRGGVTMARHVTGWRGMTLAQNNNL